MKMFELKDRVVKISNCEECNFNTAKGLFPLWYCDFTQTCIEEDIDNNTINDLCPLKDFKE
jgi:hypothetical protein